MCLPRKPTAVFPAAWFEPPERPLAIDVSAVTPTSEAPKRRRRLWELSPSAACPVLGVCLPLDVQRRLMSKCGIDAQDRSEYEVHQIAVTECRRRSALAEHVERWLDERFGGVVRRLKAVQDEGELTQRWRQARQGPGWPATMWAVLTHPSCRLPLENEVLGDVHMMQHQVGMVTRVEQQRWEALQHKLEHSQAEAKHWQARWQEAQREAQRRLELAQKEELALRGQVAALQAQCAALQQRLQLGGCLDVQASERLQAEVRQLREENQSLRRMLRAAARQQAKEAPEREAERAEMPLAEMAEPLKQGWVIMGPQVVQGLPKRVACVGGRAAQLPAYRAVVEAHGLELLHHDGGDEDSINQLPATLAAADLVICQVGCVSHNAYWRVKDHCKRQGKPCVFVESASRSALERAMSRVIAAWPRPAAA